jgi:hypothetical protein
LDFYGTHLEQGKKVFISSRVVKCRTAPGKKSLERIGTELEKEEEAFFLSPLFSSASICFGEDKWHQLLNGLSHIKLNAGPQVECSKLFQEVLLSYYTHENCLRTTHRSHGFFNFIFPVEKRMQRFLRKMQPWACSLTF